MSQVNDVADGEFEAANSRLNQGLKACRSVVDNYKSLLSSEPDPLLMRGTALVADQEPIFRPEAG